MKEENAKCNKFNCKWIEVDNNDYDYFCLTCCKTRILPEDSEEESKENKATPFLVLALIVILAVVTSGVSLNITSSSVDQLDNFSIGN